MSAGSDRPEESEVAYLVRPPQQPWLEGKNSIADFVY